MTEMTSKRESIPSLERASHNFARLMTHVASLYCLGESSSVSAYEAREIATSVSYALGIAGASPQEAARVLDVRDPVALWHTSVGDLRRRAIATRAVWRDVVATMPPIRNVALRDTLASLGDMSRRYDPCFAAHEVPGDIDYPLSAPVDPGLMGLDYVESYLAQLLAETRWIAQFDAASCTAVLERVCPDHRGLHVNLYELLLPHREELAPRRWHETGMMNDAPGDSANPKAAHDARTRVSAGRAGASRPYSAGVPSSPAHHPQNLPASTS